MFAHPSFHFLCYLSTKIPNNREKLFEFLQRNIIKLKEIHRTSGIFWPKFSRMGMSDVETGHIKIRNENPINALLGLF